MNSFFIQLFSFISSLLGIYSIILIVRIILTWIPQQQMYNQYGQPVKQERPLFDLLCKITDPYLNLFRSSRLTIGRIDFSTLIAFMVLSILKSLFTTIATIGTITIGIILGVCLQEIWSYVISYFLIALLVLLGIRWYTGKKQGQYNATLDNILKVPVNFVFNLFYKHKYVSEQKLVGTAFVFYLCVYIILRYLFRSIVPLLYSL